MDVVLHILVGVLGLLVGSFLNVVIWRIPRGESVVRPGSHCPRCGRPVGPWDNVPVLSWLLLRGRCRHCHEPISVRYPLVEAGTGVLFVAVSVWRGLAADTPAFLYLAAIAVALALIDLDTHRLPNVIVLPSYLVGLVLLAGAAGLDGEWAPMWRAVLAGAILFVVYFVLLVVYPAGMGFGDVKLAGLLGLFLGWVGWGAVVVGAFGAFLLGGVFGGLLMLLRRANRKTGIPFGPWMLLGAALGLGLGEWVWAAYLDLMM